MQRPANASAVQVVLAFESKQVTLEVCDDGRGRLQQPNGPFSAVGSGDVKGERSVNLNDHINVGAAISLRGGGLVAPALFDTDVSSVAELTAQFRDLVNRARLTLGAIVGGGSIVAAPQSDEWQDRADDEDLVRREHVDVFGVVQPEATLHVNVIRWMRFALTAVGSQLMVWQTWSQYVHYRLRMAAALGITFALMYINDCFFAFLNGSEGRARKGGLMVFASQVR